MNCTALEYCLLLDLLMPIDRFVMQMRNSILKFLSFSLAARPILTLTQLIFGKNKATHLKIEKKIPPKKIIHEKQCYTRGLRMNFDEHTSTTSTTKLEDNNYKNKTKQKQTFDLITVDTGLDTYGFWWILCLMDFSPPLVVSCGC